MDATTDQNHNKASYDPGRLLDVLMERFRLKNDAALSRTLGVPPPVISKIRHHKLPIAASLLIRIHEATDLSVAELRHLMGDRRARYRWGSIGQDDDDQSDFSSENDRGVHQTEQFSVVMQ